jgi:hypothetical protein
MVSLTQRVDPYTKDGVEITAANVGTVAGNSFTAQRLLDCYNEARVALARALMNTLSLEEASLQLGGMTKNEAITWASQVATKPTDMIAFLSMETVAGVPMTLLPSSWIGPTKAGNNPHLASTATRINIFDVGTQYVYYGTSSFVANGSGYRIRYIGIGTWVLADVTAGTAVETIEARLHPVLLELAAAISNEMGTVEIGALATKLLGGK